MLHGPYWQWSTKVAGKTVTRRLTAHEAEVYGDFVANRRRLENIVAEMEAVSARAAQILAEEGTGSATHAPPRSRATR